MKLKKNQLKQPLRAKQIAIKRTRTKIHINTN
jgi:hypothetical protein